MKRIDKLTKLAKTATDEEYQEYVLKSSSSFADMIMKYVKENPKSSGADDYQAILDWFNSEED